MERYVQEFKSICQGPGIPSTEAELSPTDARKLVLYRTNGLVKANLMVQTDGTFLSMPRLCANTLRLVEERQGFLGWGRREFLPFVKESLFAEETARSEAAIRDDLPCLLNDRQHDLVKDMMRHANSVEEFRALLLAADGMDARGIHFFQWDGSPRRTMADVYWALCHYASSHMAKTFEIVRVGGILLSMATQLAEGASRKRLLANAMEKVQGLSPVVAGYVTLFVREALDKIAVCGPPKPATAYDVYVQPFLMRHADAMLRGERAPSK